MNRVVFTQRLSMIQTAQRHLLFMRCPSHTGYVAQGPIRVESEEESGIKKYQNRNRNFERKEHEHRIKGTNKA